MGNLERGTLKLPKLGDLIQELQFDSRLRRQLVESLNSREELEGVDVDGEGRRPVVRRNHLADARLFRDRLDLGDVLERAHLALLSRYDRSALAPT